MKTTLTTEQSAALIKRGVSPDKASQSFAVAHAAANVRGLVRIPPQPIFTIADLLSLLPKRLSGEETDYCDCELHIHANKLGWSASYMEIRGSEVVVMKLTSYGVELIDALFSLVCKLLDNHVKFG